MATPVYNSTKKRDLAKDIEAEKQYSDALHVEIMSLTARGADFDEIMKVRTDRNNSLIKIETLQSRIDNIGIYTGITEQSFPKFNQ